MSKWFEDNYIIGRTTVYNKNVLKGKWTNDCDIIALERSADVNKLSGKEFIATCIVGTKNFIINPTYGDDIEDIIPTEDGFKVIIKHEDCKEKFKDLFVMGVYGSIKNLPDDMYDWNYREIPHFFEVKNG